jgi:hypothetical protein
MAELAVEQIDSAQVLAVLDGIERRATMYSMLNAFLNVAIPIASIYLFNEVSTYIWRMLTCPC